MDFQKIIAKFSMFGLITFCEHYLKIEFCLCYRFRLECCRRTSSLKSLNSFHLVTVFFINFIWFTITTCFKMISPWMLPKNKQFEVFKQLSFSHCLLYQLHMIYNYNLFQNGCHFVVLWSPFSLQIVASLLHSKFKRIFSLERSKKSSFVSKPKYTKMVDILK